MGRWLLALLTMVLIVCAAAGCTICTDDCDGYGDDDDVPADLCAWTLHPDNPLIEPPEGETLLGDPAVVPPDESPDGAWHLFANSMTGIHRYTSDDGLDWDLAQQWVVGIGAWRANIYLEDGTYHLLYEMFADVTHSEIQRITSADLVTWSNPVTVLSPTLDWEMESQETVGNPYLTQRDGEYWLYYSAAGRELPDTGFPEPLYIGLARAADLDGPWTREPEPIIAPDDGDPWRNHGAGSIKLLDDRDADGRLLALNNGIYDTDGTTGSAIRVLASDDGLSWDVRCDEPIVAPTGTGWTAAFIYAFDTVHHHSQLRLYFNARDGWETGTERIGLATNGWQP